jgi:hypothetical protein
VSERVSQILIRVDLLNSELIDFVGNLTGPDLRTPCDDPECPTVGDVVAHLAEGSKQVLGWAAVTMKGQPAQPAGNSGTGHTHGPGADHDHGPGADHDHGPGADHDHGAAGHSHAPGAGHVHVDEAIEIMQTGWTTSVKMLKNLTDEQLDSVPPNAQGIADGNASLEQILGRMMDHQEQHLNYMKAALSAQFSGEIPQAAK